MHIFITIFLAFAVVLVAALGEEAKENRRCSRNC